MSTATDERVSDDRPLSEREEQLLARLFSDPTKYPMQLKTWIISWLEGSDLSLPLSSITGLTRKLGLITDRLTGHDTALAGMRAGTIPVGLDSNGRATITFPSPIPVTAVKSIVVSNGDTASAPGVWLGLFSWTASDFTVQAYTNPGVPWTGPLRVNWIAFVTP